MSAPVPFSLTLPGTAETQIGKPVLGSTLGKLAGAANCLAGYRGRGWHPYIPSVRRDTTTLDTGLPFGLADRSEEHRVWIRTSPLSLRLELVLVVASQTIGGTSEPYVEVDLYDGTGAVVDVGVKWARDLGSLPGRDARPVRDSNTGTRWRRAWPVVISTAGVVRDHYAAGATPSIPRMLYFGTGYAGQDLQLRVQTYGTQLLSMTAIEAVEATL